jgi:hypothetical protein
VLADRTSHRANQFASLSLWLILSLPSLYFLSSFPPFWRDSDGFYQVTAKPSYLTLLHWPPLYCLTARIPIWLGDSLAARFSGKSAPAVAVDHAALGDAGVEALILLQHAILVLAVYYACISITRRPLLRIVIALLFASTPWLYAFANCIGSEAYSNVFVVLAAVSGWRVINERSLMFWEVLGWLGALAGAILSRHINTVLAVIVPGTWLLALLFERVGNAFGRPQLALRWRPLFSLAGLSLATIIACQLMTFALCGAYKVPFRSRVGYVFQWRLGYLSALAPDQRDARLERIAKKLNDPSVTYAVRQVELALGNNSKWEPELLSQSIYNWLRSNTKEPFGKRSLAMDGRLNAIAKEFLLSGDRSLYARIGLDFFASLQFTAPDITKEPFLATDWLEGYLTDPVFEPVKNLKTFQNRTGSWIEHFAVSPYCQLWRGVPLWVIGFCGFGLAVAFLIRKFSSPDSLLRCCYAIMLVATGLLLCLINCTLTFLAPRFTLSMAVLFVVGFCIALSLLIDGNADF